MRIAMLYSLPFPPEDGIGNFVFNLAKHLQGRGHEVELFTRGAGFGPTLHRSSGGVRANCIAIPPAYPFHVDIHGLLVQRALNHRRDDFDVLHVHTPLPPNVRVPWPVVLTVHTTLRAETRAINTRDVFSRLQRLQAWASRRTERSLIEQASIITAVSTSVAQDLAEYDVPRGEVTILPNSVDVRDFSPADRPREGFLLFVGRLAPRKGIAELIRAVAGLKRRGIARRLIIVGKGPLEQSLRKEVDRADLASEVEFRGFVDRAALVDLLRRCEVFVLPSLYEGLPTTALEAMATGAPVVGTRAPGVVDLIEDETDGLLVPVRDHNALADAILRIVGNPALGAKLGAAARRKVETSFSWELTALRAEKLYLACTDVAQRTGSGGVS